MRLRRSAAVFALFFGIAGVVACMAGVWVVRSLESRAERASDRLFAIVDNGLLSAQDILHRVDARVTKAIGTTTELRQTLQEFDGTKVREFLASQTEIQRRAEALSGHLQTIDLSLETSVESIRGVRRAVELCDSIGVPMNPAPIDNLLEIITSLRSSLQLTSEGVNGFALTIARQQNDLDEKRLSQLLQLFDHILPPISDTGSRLDEAMARLSSLRTDADKLQAKTSNWITGIAVACFILLAWIAAGQIALSHWGRSNCRSVGSSA